MKTAIRFGLLIALCLLLAGVSSAITITYTESALATGTIGSFGFQNALVTLTMTGDTTGVQNLGGGFFQNIGTLEVNVSGFGTATFTGVGFGVFDNQVFSPPAAGGFRSGSGSILDTFDNVFATYDLTTAIGPITGSSFIRPDLFFATSAGNFNLQSAGDSTFTASTVPEPGSMVLFGTGLSALAGIIRRKLRA